MHRPAASYIVARLLVFAAIGGLAPGCDSIEKATPRPRAARASGFELNVPRIMQGTIRSESILLGYNSVIVRGYGLVVGLQGTGSREMPPAVRAHMLGEMARRGVGQESAGFGHMKPEAMLDSLDTAVVIVEGVIPPGAVARETRRGVRLDGTRFDVRVYADPRTGTTSLEGGQLWTAELRPVVGGEVLPSVGSRQPAALATARGPIFVNPFAEAGGGATVGINHTIGRIMNGGVAVRDMPLKLRLASPSHARAEVIQGAINSRFPREPGQRDQTARGESGELIRVNVPLSYRDETEAFVELLRHTTIRQAGAEAVALGVKSVLLNDPSVANAAAWRWEALGVRALPTIQDLYDYPEELPRLAALTAGSRLGDPLVTPALIAMTESDLPEARRKAVELLADLPMDPRIDESLRGLLSDPEIDVRLAAYESAIQRADPFISRFSVDGNFVLDVVDSDVPLIYITQIGQPRVALFGRDVMLRRPTLVDAWSGRLLLKASPGDESVEVYYRPEDGGERRIETADVRLSEFIRFLGHQPTVDRPEPGLGLSYGETVGALYQMWQQESLALDFKSQQDRVLAAILSQQATLTRTDRPEFGDPDFDFLQPAGDEPPPDGSGRLPDADPEPPLSVVPAPGG